MIIQTSMRTDIPAFYSQWFINRLKEGFVCVRNPYSPASVTKYSLLPKVVDLIVFCTKNPEPILRYIDFMKEYNQYWFITITPYGKEIEPYVPPKEKVINSFKSLSSIVGINSVSWRYDPIFISEKYSLQQHISDFEVIAASLSGYTNVCVISFIDLYKKVIRNFPEIKKVTKEQRIFLGKEFIRIGKKYNITIRPCAEGNELAKYGADCNGCMTAKIFEKALNSYLDVPTFKSVRKECACLLGNDIGAYNTCQHFCRYCYANTDRSTVLKNVQNHDFNSPFLIGNYMPNDIVKDAKQKSWLDNQLRLPL